MDKQRVHTNPQHYSWLTEQLSPPSPLGAGLGRAFWVGGLICVAGQLLIDLTGLTPARILTGYVVAGVVLSAIGWYAPLAEFAGCGATVPLLGFGHLLAKGVRTALQEEGAVGILTGGLTAAAAGVTTSLVCGVVCSWVGKSHDQN